LHARALFADRLGDDFRRHRLAGPALGDLQRAPAGANDSERHAGTVTDDPRDRVRAERLFGASGGAQPMTYQPGHVRLGHRLEFRRTVRRRPFAISGDCREARRDAGMSCQDDREETTICRLQSGQRDERFQHIIAEEIGVIEQKDR
jgi:hypothetical protein